MAVNPFWEDGIRKQIVITYDGNKTITNTELYSEAFELTERLCSTDNLRFGSCESSVVKFRITNTFEQLKDKDIDIGMYLENMEGKFSVGKYKVFSDTPSANRKYRSIVAYDAMATIIGLNVIDWYNGIFEENEELTLKEFRDSFFEYVGVTQKSANLPNDSMIVTKTLDKKELAGGDVASRICEINGCFGHINRSGLFEYVFLTELGETISPSNILYPSNSLFPAAGDGSISNIGNSRYISAEYKDYCTEQINKLQIRNEENSVGCEYGSGDNVYVIEDNFLVFEKEEEELEEIAENLYDVISVIWYMPASVYLKGNLQFNVGDAIELVANSKHILTYILERTLTGIQSLKDSFYAEGLERQPEVDNSVESALADLNGQTKSLIMADKVITQNLDAAVARIGIIEADYITTTQLNAVDAKIDNLSAIAITTENLYAQTISGGQITAGTITVDRLSSSSLAAASLTVNSMTLNSILHCKFGGSTNFGLNYVDVSDPSDLIGAKVAVFYAE